LPDLIVDHIPYLPLVDRFNAWLLALCYVPLSFVFLLLDPLRFCRYTVTTGVLSIVRGVCIALTGLGPVRGPDVNAGLGTDVLIRAWLELMSPAGLLLRDAPHVYLTKDLFFSGHTSVTFLLFLYLLRYPRMALLMLAAHLCVVASVFLAHLHYTIDVVGAYAIAFSLFVLREGDLRRLLGPPQGRSAPAAPLAS
jgi:hypothetical protein